MRIAPVATVLCPSAGGVQAQARETPAKVLEEMRLHGPGLFVFAPFRFKGATGSPGRPIALR